MATVLDAFLITFGLDPSGIKKGADEGKSALDDLKSTALKAFAVIGGAALIKSAFSHYLEAADSVAKLSDAMGENASEMQAWGGAVALEGGSIESFNGSIKNLNEQMVQIATTGAGRSKKFFDALGISATDATGKVKPATSVLLELSDKFAGLSAQKAAGLGAKIGLDAGMIHLLMKGRQGVEDMLKAQKELGEYTKKDMDAAQDFNDSIDMTGKAMSMTAAKIFTLFAPSLTKLSNFVREAMIVMREWVEKVMPQLEAKLASVSAFFEKHGALIGAALTAVAAILAYIYVPAMLSAAAASFVAMLPLILIVAAIAAVSLAIGALVEDFLVWQAGGESAFGGVYQAVADFWAKVKPIVDLFINYFSAGWGLIFAAAKTAFAFLKGLFTGDFSEFFAAIDGLQEKFAAFWGAIKALAQPFFDWLAEKFAWIGDAVGGAKSLLGIGGDDKAGAGGVSASEAISPLAAGGANSTSKSVTATQQIGNLNVYSAAKDAAGIGKDIAGATSSGFGNLVMAADSGVVQ